MYRVVHEFFDLEDENKTIYHVGETFPYDSREISKKRLKELSSKKNKIGDVLIEYVDVLDNEEKLGNNHSEDDLDNSDETLTDLENLNNNDKDNLDKTDKVLNDSQKTE